MTSGLFNRRDILAYFIVAAIGASLQLVAGSLFQEWFQFSYEQALLAGYVIAFVVGFFLTKLFAFNAKNSTKTQREAIKFTLVSIVSCLITVYGSSFLYDYSVGEFEVLTLVVPFSVKLVNVNKLVAHTTGMGVSFLSNYVLHKTFTFHNTGFYERLKRLLNL
ncbi:GtrA family protein [Spirosoma fluviale]|uniref:Flippase GtrA (Transmembrane translocase of bactoprenol-linked glucose) n=1 Tax=Spirosoma fluviale TaxID=1597977 RepID=A0A286FZB7_9BACT|nr:GtrA family protein [Spirosoma fluviale]SOD88548.1 Putative flippase GtrA (transmembrane translocase of bactoprenol-linked glucose) [Spirosoma fluviale]